jgi:hypothetical protein
VADKTSSDFSELHKPLEHFRAKTKRLKVHPLELGALWVVCAHLVFLPWALGGMRLWAQWMSLAFGILAFGISLVPRSYTEEHTGSNRFRLILWPKLLKFPVFWLGLALLGLVLIQALNPAWGYKTDGKVFWMQRIAHKEWLPAGVSAPLEKWNQWRMLMIYSSGWLTVCAMWVAFSRRRTVQAFFMVLAFNGLLLAGLGVAQRLLGNGKIFWFFNSPNSQFFSSFVYKNHAGAYFVLALSITCGLAAWYYLRGLRRMEKSNPSGVFAFFATCIAVSVLTSYARGATLTMLVFLLVCIGVFVIHQLVMPSENRKPIVAIVLILIFGYFLKTGMTALRSHEAWDRLKQGITREDMSLEYRERATRAALEMLSEKWHQGAGAGSFRHLFPIYQHRHTDLTATPMFWEHAHNDILQFPIELGAVGVALIAIGFAYWIFRLTRSYFWENPLSGSVIFGAVLVLAYSWWDFPFQCPAILITWCALWAAATMWTEFEEQNVKG